MRLELVLGAGAAHGLAHLGAIAELETDGHEIVAVHGSSMGALVGAAWAAGSFDPLLELAESARVVDAARIFEPGLPWRSLVGGRRIEALLAELIGDVALEDLDVPTRIVATDADTWLPVALTEGPAASAVLGSIAVPGLLRPHRHQGRLLLDGTLTDPLPIPLERLGSEGAADVAAERLGVDGRAAEAAGRLGVGGRADEAAGRLGRGGRAVEAADAILAIDVLGPTGTAWPATGVAASQRAFTAIQHSLARENAKSRAEAIIWTIPSGPEASSSFHRSPRIVAKGRVFAREHLHELEGAAPR